MDKFRSKKELQKKLIEIKNERKTIRQFSMFGKDNWSGMDNEIDWLERIIGGKADEEDAEDRITELQDEYGEDEAQMEDSEIYILEWALGIRGD